MSYMDELNFWLNDDYFDQKTKDELLAIRNNEAEVEDRFYKELEFGTGGLRGVIGAGTNRMNVYTVRKATQGLANYIIKRGTQSKGVAIAFDSRRMSPEFSDEAARCLAANGIKAYIFESLRPTPELSFALRTLGCTAGIVVTASHNPPEYNGYKVYWEDGAQVTAPIDKDIITEVQSIKDYHTVKTMSREDAVAAGLYEVIGKEIDDKYMAELKKQIIHPDVIREMADDIKIVYTPLCGTGNKPVRRICLSWDSSMSMWFPSRRIRILTLPHWITRTLRIPRHLPMRFVWRRRRMRISFWQPIPMQTVWVCMQKIPRLASMWHLPVICPAC